MGDFFRVTIPNFLKFNASHDLIRSGLYQVVLGRTCVSSVNFRFSPFCSGIGFGPFNAFCLMVFCLFYIPCAATQGTIRNGSNSWAWMGFTAFFQLAKAWLVTFGVYQLGTLLMT